MRRRDCSREVAEGLETGEEEEEKEMEMDNEVEEATDEVDTKEAGRTSAEAAAIIANPIWCQGWSAHLGKMRSPSTYRISPLTQSLLCMATMRQRICKVPRYWAAGDFWVA